MEGGLQNGTAPVILQASRGARQYAGGELSSPPDSGSRGNLSRIPGW